LRHFDEKKICPKELTKNSFARIKTLNTKLNAFVTLTEDLALKKTQESAERIKNGKRLPLDGILIGVKDNFCTRGIATTCASM
jgi:aspartyl-tRNA(Asn)/glutamyl-tRNA(Gln) amidotransferase subunit A